MRQNKIKFLLLIFLTVVLMYIFCHYFLKDSISVILPDNLVYNDSLITGMYVDNVLCSYDSKSNIYFSNIDDVDGISFYSKYNNLKYVISGSSHNLYSVFVYNDVYYYNLNLVISDVPIVNIYDLDIFKYGENNEPNILFDVNSTDDDYISDRKKIGISISNILQNNGKISFSSFGYMTERGASSSFFYKKSYKLELNDDFGILNVKDDNIWVLDALYTDSSKIRNKLSSDMWNLINNNQNIDNDLNCVFVEVFINNEYVGLYALKEKVDKSVTKNTDSGLLLKATMQLWDDRIVKFLSNPNVIYNNMVLNFEIKDFNDMTYNNFVRNMYSFYSGVRNYDAVSDVYYIDNYLNYKLFVAFINGGDNATSNQYYSMIDANSKILITPWDMDLTWGLYWNLDTSLHSEFSMESSYNADLIDGNITKNMDEKTLGLMRKRYWELRKNVITMDTINGYLDSYKDILVNSGAAKRDSERWYEYDVEFEIEQIREWAQRRIEFLDEYFK